ncbi:sigma-54-dependent transcriptional regulator [Microbulbifer harenosus]|uniref:Sigma-54-dependent Fis family transcriptional regulator n=1 Tax=Microbulbifer harenosus TaxID=2576840 RepID=A0ABY2UE69_9GAMM|nr:sigma-54 dependent transcriptional regulator [Microbulbifer harenosus]TLM74824.1 sigma-54-dependent Fis family transcriptional regulator [Microbulbifer harenosus]
MPDRQPIALVVDDEPDICNLISMTLQRMNVRADIAMSVAEARRRLAEKQYHFCLTDMRLPDGDGLQIVETIQDLPADRALPVAVITAHGNMDSAITALKLGAFDFVSKPVNLERLRSLVQLALRLTEGRFLESQEFPALFQGQSEAIQTLRAQIEKIARSDAPVHITGEPGSGKELAARCIHEQGPRSNRAFITLHCESIAAEQLERHLFGDEYDRGQLHAANGGTLYLDEVNALPQELQTKLLNTLQEESFSNSATGEKIKLDIRIITGSRKRLADEARRGAFRSDLYYRLNVIELAIPPLRQRQEDIPLLTRNLLRRISAESRGATPKASQDAIQALQAYPFPGNLRELENILERAVTLGESSTLYASDLIIPAASPIPGDQIGDSVLPGNAKPISDVVLQLPAYGHQTGYPGQFATSEFETLDDFLQSIEREAIESALNETGWNRTAAAEKLGISFRSLRYRLKKLGLESE